MPQPPHEKADGELAFHVVERVGRRDKTPRKSAAESLSELFEIRRHQMFQCRELPDDASRHVIVNAHQKLRKKFAPRNADSRKIFVVCCMDDGDVRFVHSRVRPLFRIPGLRIRRVDVDDEFLAFFRVVDYFLEALRQFVERVVEEVELEDVAFEEVCTVLRAFAHHVDILLVQGRRPDAVFVRESGQEVSRPGAAVPDVILVLPVLAKLQLKVMLGQLHPFLRSEERALAFAHVLRHEQIEAVDDEVPVVLPRRSLVATPEFRVCVESGGLESESEDIEKIVLVLSLDGVRRGRSRVKRDVEVIGYAVVGDVGRPVVLDVHLGEIEVPVVDVVLLLEDVPRRVDMRHDDLAPLTVDVREVVLVDEYLRDVAASRLEVALDEPAQNIAVLRISEEKLLAFDNALCKRVEFLELL